MSARQPATIRQFLHTASVRALILGAAFAVAPQTASAQTTNVWDGTDTTGDGIVTGGSGTWTVGGTNWVDSTGTANGPYDPNMTVVFRGPGGTVTVDNSNGQILIRDTNQFAPTGLHLAAPIIAFKVARSTLAVPAASPRSGSATGRRRGRRSPPRLPRT